MNIWNRKDQTSAPLPFPAILAAGLIWIAACGTAAADLRVCNKTESVVGLAIGYELNDQWISEGWWNLEKGKCETVLRGVLEKTKFLIHAIDYDKGGQWNGEAFMCTQDLEFKIKGTQECVARGFERTGFFEVDTAGKQDYTVQLTDQQ